MQTKILFVYNADSDPVNKLIDFAHKIVSPATYSCPLCNLTHNHFGPRKNWKKFLRDSKFDFMVLYKNQFEQKFDQRYQYPVILTQTDVGLNLLMDKTKISSFKTIDQLLEAVLNQMASHNKPSK